MDDSMQVVWHQAELQNADGRIVPAHHVQLIDNSITQSRPLYSSIRGNAIRNYQSSKQRFTRRHRQRDMIHPNTTPCRPRFLPSPLSQFHHILPSLFFAGTKLRNNLLPSKEKAEKNS
jgi:hypothetical protein